VLDTKQYWEKQDTNAYVSLHLSLYLTHKYTLILISNTGILAGENLNKYSQCSGESKRSVVVHYANKIHTLEDKQIPEATHHYGPYLHFMNYAYCITRPVVEVIKNIVCYT